MVFIPLGQHGAVSHPGHGTGFCGEVAPLIGYKDRIEFIVSDSDSSLMLLSLLASLLGQDPSLVGYLTAAARYPTQWLS